MELLWRLLTIEHGASALHGIRTELPRPKGLVVHVHGTWGNFYANAFIGALATYYASKEWAFLTANYPGHDETAVHERFEDFPAALSAWLATAPDDLPIILQGHSLGALKLLYALKNEHVRRRPLGLVLLSPFDVVAFYGTGDDRERQRRRAVVADLLAQNGPSSLVPKSIFNLWDIGARAFLDATTADGLWDQFPSRREDLAPSLGDINVPVFVAIGEADFAAYPSPRAVASQLAAIARVGVGLIEGASHGYGESLHGLVRALEDSAIGELLRRDTRYGQG